MDVVYILDDIMDVVYWMFFI